MGAIYLASRQGIDGVWIVNPFYRVLRVDVATRSWNVKEYDVKEERVLGPIDAGVKIHLEEVESWRYDVFDPRNVLLLGCGLFAGSKLFGVHRLVAVFRSPESKVLHVSTMGGAAYKFVGCGAHAVAIEGKAQRPTIVVVKGGKEGVEKVEFVELYEDQLWDIFTFYEGYRGAYALTKWIVDNMRDVIERYRARIVAVGPAAFKTIFGALVSIDVDPKSGRLVEGSEDFAARGAPGSVLARAHNVVAIVAGGDWTPPIPEELKDPSKLNELFNKLLGKSFVDTVLSAGKKYRYDPSYGVGGTFGVNYPHYRELLPMFNFNSMYLDKSVRKRLADIIIEKFWKPFKVETFDKNRVWRTCGEPCPLACKKVWRGKKVDYEPFQGFGPLLGIFDLELTTELVDLVDQLGFDAIGTAQIVAWLLEAVYRGLLSPEEIGIGAKPNLDPMTMNLEAWSVNAILARQILLGLVEHKTEVLKIVAENGLRKAAKLLDEKFAERIARTKIRFEDLAIYLPYGDDGYMTPNLYWAPGFIAPIMVTGRYWTNYSATFAEPEEFAKSVCTRALKEYEDDNAGVCRFHRGWFEKIAQKLYELIGIEIDLDEHAKEVYRKFIEYAKKAGYVPRYLESEKAKDLYVTIAREIGVYDWFTKFVQDKDGALKEWWKRFSAIFAEFMGVEPSYVEL